MGILSCFVLSSLGLIMDRRTSDDGNASRERNEERGLDANTIANQSEGIDVLTNISELAYGEGSDESERGSMANDGPRLTDGNSGDGDLVETTVDDLGSQMNGDERMGGDDWIRTGQTFDYFEDSYSNDQTDTFEEEVCPCGASGFERCRFASIPDAVPDDWEDAQPIQYDDWDDPPALGTVSRQEQGQTDEQDERDDFVDEYLRGKAMEDMWGFVATLIAFLVTIHGIKLDE